MKEVLGVYSQELERQLSAADLTPSPFKKGKTESITEPPPPMITTDSRIVALRDSAMKVLGEKRY